MILHITHFRGQTKKNERFNTTQMQKIDAKYFQMTDNNILLNAAMFFYEKQNISLSVLQHFHAKKHFD